MSETWDTFIFEPLGPNVRSQYGYIAGYVRTYHKRFRPGLAHDTFLVFYLEFSASEQFSINLQTKDISIQEAIAGAKLLSTHLKSLTYETNFDPFMIVFSMAAEI